MPPREPVRLTEHQLPTEAQLCAVSRELDRVVRREPGVLVAHVRRNGLRRDQLWILRPVVRP